MMFEPVRGSEAGTFPSAQQPVSGRMGVEVDGRSVVDVDIGKRTTGFQFIQGRP